MFYVQLCKFYVVLCTFHLHTHAHALSPKGQQRSLIFLRDVLVLNYLAMRNTVLVEWLVSLTTKPDGTGSHPVGELGGCYMMSANIFFRVLDIYNSLVNLYMLCITCLVHTLSSWNLPMLKGIINDISKSQIKYSIMFFFHYALISRALALISNYKCIVCRAVDYSSYIFIPHGNLSLLSLIFINMFTIHE
jgi:hypothetical protein